MLAQVSKISTHSTSKNFDPLQLDEYARRLFKPRRLKVKVTLVPYSNEKSGNESDHWWDHFNGSKFAAQKPGKYESLANLITTDPPLIKDFSFLEEIVEFMTELVYRISPSLFASDKESSFPGLSNQEVLDLFMEKYAPQSAPPGAGPYLEDVRRYISIV